MIPSSCCGPGPPYSIKKSNFHHSSLSSLFKCVKTSENDINYFDNNFKRNIQKKRKMKKRIKKHQKHIRSDSIRKTTTIISSSSLSSSLSTSVTTNWISLIIYLLLFILLSAHGVDAEKSKHYYMQSLCKNHFLQQLYRKIDGAVLWSQNERNLDCIITFQTHSILQRFMLRFDMLQLDCNDHLYVYDGAHAVGTYKVDLSCRNTKHSVGSIFTRTNFVTLKYVTDGWGTDTNGFKLVITAVKDPKHACKNFRCTLREFCIHPDLICDGVNHCGDGSDESTTALCPSQDQQTLLGLELTWFVLISVCSVLIVSACIVGWSICICRRTNQNTSIQLRQTSAETNGSSKHLHGTLPREQTTLPTSGNWHHPAGPSGYHRIQHKFKMATKVRPIWCLANLDN